MNEKKEKWAQDMYDDVKMKLEQERQHNKHMEGVNESKKYLDKDGVEVKGGNVMAGEDNATEEYGWWYGAGKPPKKYHKDQFDDTKVLPWQNYDPENRPGPLGNQDSGTEMVKWYTGKRKDWWDKYQPQEMAREIQTMVVKELAKLKNRL